MPEIHLMLDDRRRVAAFLTDKARPENVNPRLWTGLRRSFVWALDLRVWEALCAAYPDLREVAAASPSHFVWRGDACADTSD